MTLSAALASGDVRDLPSRREEDWRWTDLRGLLRVLPPPSPEDLSQVPAGPFAGLAQAEVLVVNGRVRGDASALQVGAGERRMVALRFVSTTDAASHGVDLTISIGAGGVLTLLESYEGRASDYVADTRLTMTLAQGAALERITLAGDGEGAINVSTATVSVAAQARFAQTLLTDGAKRQRIETRVAHPGGHAAVRLDGVYLTAGQRHCDLTTVVVHGGTDGTTSQLTKGVVRDQARGVFQGKIIVSEGADRTDARMGHHALILSDRAEIDAKPELEIYADDVACAHGNTVGALDEDAMFYARQRGMPEDVARALLTEAFVGEVIDRIEHEAAREAARAWVAARLGT